MASRRRSAANEAKELTGMNYNCSVLLPKTDPQIQES
jgi:hypothetical protein